MWNNWWFSSVYNFVRWLKNSKYYIDLHRLIMRRTRLERKCWSYSGLNAFNISIRDIILVFEWDFGSHPFEKHLHSCFFSHAICQQVFNTHSRCKFPMIYCFGRETMENVRSPLHTQTHIHRHLTHLGKLQLISNVKQMQRVQVTDTLRNPFRHHCRCRPATCNLLNEESNLLSFVGFVWLVCKTFAVELCYVSLLCSKLNNVVICVGVGEFISR